MGDGETVSFASDNVRRHPTTLMICGGSSAESEEQPHAKQITHACQPPMRGPHEDGKALQIPGVAERTEESRPALQRVTKMRLSMDPTLLSQLLGNGQFGFCCGLCKASIESEI